MVTLDFETEKEKIERHFQMLKAEKMRSLHDQIIAQERACVDHMTDKQTQEMLKLIDKKVVKTLLAVTLTLKNSPCLAFLSKNICI